MKNLTKKLPIKGSGVMKALETTELINKMVNLHTNQVEHERSMDKIEKQHQIKIDQANGIANYRREFKEDLTDAEKEMLTRGFVEKIIG